MTDFVIIAVMRFGHEICKMSMIRILAIAHKKKITVMAAIQIKVRLLVLSTDGLSRDPYSCFVNTK